MYEHRSYEQVALAKRRCPIRLDGAYGTGIFGGHLASPWSASVAACGQSDVMLPRFFAHFKLRDMTLRHLRRFGRQAPWVSDNQRARALQLR